LSHVWALSDLICHIKLKYYFYKSENSNEE
jgi:hypothetical protein